MLTNVDFEHQDYLPTPAPDSYRLASSPKLDSVVSNDFLPTMDSVGSSLRKCGVNRVILVHGTMVGTDALGWYSHWQRVTPWFATKLKSTYQSIVERLSGDQGNFTSDYENLIRRSLNNFDNEPKRTDPDGETEIAVERFNWTSENHHLGRANAAVVLAHRLIKLAQDGERRVLLIGHSHAGNVFALVSQLLGGLSPNSRQAFFDAGRCFSQHSSRIDVDSWKALEQILRSASAVTKPELDIVTLGTPVRYGWNSSGYKNLLHFVNHHPTASTESFRGIVPSNPQEFLDAISGKHGDFVQQTFIARTDLPPAIWSWNAWNANRQLRELLESKDENKSRATGLSQGVRVPNSGKTLLVDYANTDSSATDFAGHSVYTKSDWMSFHMREIVKQFYASSPAS